jgi:DNA-directed RNA polymerase subunit M/transcription elongation factor TFIIS
MEPGYILQTAHKSHCDQCGETLALLCEGDPRLTLEDFTWFYICFKCQRISQVGVGLVRDEREIYAG